MDQMASSKSLMNLVEVYQTSQAIMTANKLGIFRALESGHNTVNRVAGKLRLSNRGVERLLQSLASLGIIRSEDGPSGSIHYGLTPLGRDSFGSDGKITAWTEHYRTLFQLWSELPTSIERGTAILKRTHDIDVDSYARGLMESYLLTQRKLHDVVDLDGDVRLLDMGGGAGHYTILAVK